MREDYRRFEQILSEKGLTPYRVSKETGVAPSALTNWKKGICKPKIDKIIRIAEYLECPIEVLL